MSMSIPGGRGASVGSLAGTVPGWSAVGVATMSGSSRSLRVRPEEVIEEVETEVMTLVTEQQH